MGLSRSWNYYVSAQRHADTHNNNFVRFSRYYRYFTHAMSLVFIRGKSIKWVQNTNIIALNADDSTRVYY